MQQKVYKEAIAQYYQFIKGFIKIYYPDAKNSGLLRKGFRFVRNQVFNILQTNLGYAESILDVLLSKDIKQDIKEHKFLVDVKIETPFQKLLLNVYICGLKAYLIFSKAKAFYKRTIIHKVAKFMFRRSLSLLRCLYETSALVVVRTFIGLNRLRGTIWLRVGGANQKLIRVSAKIGDAKIAHAVAYLLARAREKLELARGCFGNSLLMQAIANFKKSKKLF